MAKQLKFDKLGWLYIIALSCIAGSIIIGQLVVQDFIGRQQDDSRLINIAGKQRMLSQKITKIALQIEKETDSGIQKALAVEMEQLLEQWTRAHVGLQTRKMQPTLSGENSPEINKFFKQIEPDFNEIAGSVKGIIRVIQQSDSLDQENIKLSIEKILVHEPQFLSRMDDIVLQYDLEARTKVGNLKRTEVILLMVALSIIILELLFIFRPIAIKVRQTVSGLMASEAKSLKMAGEMSRLYEELVDSYQELEAVNLKPEAPTLYATIDSNGAFIYFSEQFQQLMGYNGDSIPKRLNNLLLNNGYSDEFTNGLIDIINKEQKWNGEIKVTNVSGDFCWLEIYIIPTWYENKLDHKIIARNITEVKEAGIRSREINRAKIEARVREQEYRSVLILEGQEEERQRLGREIHDGMGQMLTALKLSLESITPSSSKHTVKRLEDAKLLMKSILKEVRRISFNLIPSSLTDFGIVPAVKKFCQEVDRYAASQIVFENRTRFVNRLDQHLENNLYRIIQEAVNNAIKYAQAKIIKVIFEHDHKELSIVIEDNGKGFDYEKLLNSGYFTNTGHGIFNMKERAAFIHSKFELFSEQGKGTKIVIKLPLD